MYHQFYEGSSLLGFAIFALIFFIAAFSVVVAMTWRRVPRNDALAQLPFSDDTSPHSGEPHHV
jgi:Na+/proline symporter